MKVTHIHYQHPNHLRVEDGKERTAYTAVNGYFKTVAACVSPSSSRYDRLFRKDLPEWKGDYLDENNISRPL